MHQMFWPQKMHQRQCLLSHILQGTFTPPQITILFRYLPQKTFTIENAPSHYSCLKLSNLENVESANCSPTVVFDGRKLVRWGIVLYFTCICIWICICICICKCWKCALFSASRLLWEEGLEVRRGIRPTRTTSNKHSLLFTCLCSGQNVQKSVRPVCFLYLNFVSVRPNCIWCILVFCVTHAGEAANTRSDRSKTCLIFCGLRILCISYLFQNTCILYFSWHMDEKQQALLSPVCLLRAQLSKCQNKENRKIWKISANK